MQPSVAQSSKIDKTAVSKKSNAINLHKIPELSQTSSLQYLFQEMSALGCHANN